MLCVTSLYVGFAVNVISCTFYVFWAYLKTLSESELHNMQWLHIAV